MKYNDPAILNGSAGSSHFPSLLGRELGREMGGLASLAGRSSILAGRSSVLADRASVAFFAWPCEQAGGTTAAASDRAMTGNLFMTDMTFLATRYPTDSE